MNNAKSAKHKPASKSQGRRAGRGAAPNPLFLKAAPLLLVLGILVAGGIMVWQRLRPITQSQSLTASGGNTSPTSDGSSAKLAEMTVERKKEGNAAILNGRANDLLKAGQLPQAIQAYQQAIALSPKDEDLHFNLGIAYARSGDLTNAEAHYLEALKLLPDYPEVHNNLGNVLMREGRMKEAEEHFQEALKQMPDYAQANNNMGILLQGQKKTNEALAFFQKAVESDTNYWEARFNLANAYMRVNDKEKAIAELRETLRLQPTFEAGQRMLAKLTGANATNAVPTKESQ